MPSTAVESYFAFNVPSNDMDDAGHQMDQYALWQPQTNPPMFHQDSGYFSRLASGMTTPAFDCEVPMLSSAASTTSTTHSAGDSPLTPLNQDLPSPEIPAKPEGKILRPPNAWILYRSDKLLEVKEAKATIKTPQAELSKMIAERWRAEAPEVKRKYELQAQYRKQEHDAQHPG